MLNRSIVQVNSALDSSLAEAVMLHCENISSVHYLHCHHCSPTSNYEASMQNLLLPKGNHSVVRLVKAVAALNRPTAARVKKAS